MAVSDGASCYICLDEGPDEAGKPLVRDCSCRGDTAGFAHLSCIIEYAVALDLSSAFILFAEEAYGFSGNDMWDKVKVMSAL